MNWIVLLLLLLCAALPVLFLILYFRAMAPRAGTLEWITRTQRTQLTLTGSRRRLGRNDALPMLLAGIWALGLRLLALAFDLGGFSGLTRYAVPVILDLAFSCLLLPLISCLLLYVLLKEMGISRSNALATAALLPLLPVKAPLLLAVTAADALLLWRFFVPAKKDDALTGRLYLAGAAVLTGMGGYFSPGCLWLGLLLPLLLLTASIFRAVRGGRRLAVLWDVFWYLAALALCALLVHVPGALIAGYTPLDGRFWLWLLAAPAYGLRGALAFPVWSYLTDEWPLLFLILAAAVTCAAALVRRPEGADLFALELWIAGLLLSLLIGAPWFFCGLPALACCWNRLAQRSHRLTVLSFGWSFLLAVLHYLFRYPLT